MERKKIKFFLGSSITEFKNERTDLHSFAKECEKYVRGADIEFFLCENALDKSQNAIDEYIKNDADICIFVFGNSVGDVTEHEVDIAGETRKTNDKYRPAWQFFVLSDKSLSFETASEQARDLAEKVNKKYSGQYVQTFADFSEIKLFIMQSCLSILNRLKDLKAEDGKLCIDNIEIKDINLDELPVYANNAEYVSLKSEITELKTKLDALRLTGSVETLLSVSGKINAKTEILNKLESDTLSFMNNIFTRLKQADVDELVVRAHTLLRDGRLDEAKNLITADDLRRENEAIKFAENYIADNAEKIVQKAKTEIEVWSLDISDKNRFDKIDEYYNSVWDSALAASDFEFILDRIEFLQEQNKDKQALELLKTVEGHFRYKNASRYYMARLYILIASLLSDVPGQQKEEESYLLRAENLFADNELTQGEYGIVSQITNNLGLYYRNQRNSDKAKAYLQKSLQTRQKLAEKNPEKYNGILSVAYNNLGCCLDDQGEYEEAEECYNKSLQIRQKLAEENPGIYNEDLSNAYNNLGCRLDDQEKYKEAEAFYTKALQIRQKLAEENPERYNNVLALSYYNLGFCFRIQGKNIEAKEFYNKALHLRQKLAEENPEKYSSFLAISYYNLGSDFADQEKYEEAEEFYNKALQIRQKLAEENPERYNDALANSYYNLGCYFADLGKHKKAEEVYNKSLNIFLQLSEINSEKYNEVLYDVYNNLGCCFADQGKYKEAEECYNKALETRQKFDKENTDTYIGKLASYYNNLGCRLDDQRKYKEAEEFYNKALQIRKKLAEENPERYDDYLASYYNNLGCRFDKQKKYKEAEDLYNKGLQIWKRLAEKNPQKYSGDLADFYINLGSFYRGQKKYKEAEEYKNNGLHILYKLAEQTISTH